MAGAARNLLWIAALFISFTPCTAFVSNHGPRFRRSSPKKPTPLLLLETYVSNDNDNNDNNNTPMAPLVPLTDATEKAYSGKTVFLTGATGGLGTSLALQLSHWNVKRLILSGRKRNALESVAAQCRQTNAAIAIDLVVCDLADPSSVDQAAQEVVAIGNEHNGGKMDVVILNGGVSSRSRFLDTLPQVDAKILQINFLSGAALAKALIPGMVKSNDTSDDCRGRVIWISSLQGLMGIPNRSSYAASKFAVQGYTESIRAELTSSRVYVHTVSPGYIRTNLSQGAITGDGSAYGVTDPTTAAGADPNEVAAELLTRVAKGQMDFKIATSFTSMVAYWLRFLFPGLLRLLLVKRYEKSLIQNDKDDDVQSKKQK